MDDLVKRLRAVDHGSIEDCFTQSPLFERAAAAIEAQSAMLRECVEALESVVLAADLPGDHCEMEQATIHARTTLAKAEEMLK